jgi:hypothetical protein
MKRILAHRSFVVLAVAALALAAETVWAQNPHFVTVNGNPSGTDFGVCFKEAGLGDNQLIAYVASADATAQYVCINGGNKHPQATNKETVSGPVSATGTFSSGKNGTINQCLTLHAPSAGSFSCPSGQTLAVACVEYTDIDISDTTNNVSASVPDSGVLESTTVAGQFCTLE